MNFKDFGENNSGFKELLFVKDMVGDRIRWKIYNELEGTLGLMVDLVSISEVHILIEVIRELDTSYLKKIEVTERILEEL